MSPSELLNIIKNTVEVNDGYVDLRELNIVYPRLDPVLLKQTCEYLDLKYIPEAMRWVTREYFLANRNTVQFSRFQVSGIRGLGTRNPQLRVSPSDNGWNEPVETPDQLPEQLQEEPPIVKTVEFDSVVLAADKKEEILAALAQVRHKDKIFKEWGFETVFEKGTAISLLFYGIPGTGKTLMAQAIADYLGYDLKVYGTAEIQSSEPGGAERAIKKIFQEATELITGKKRQRVILFDECDSLLSSRQNVGTIMAAQINTLLSEIEHYGGVIIFTTNRLGKLDAALERRIAAKIEFTFPDKAARKDIWLRLIPEKAPIHSKVSFSQLAEYPIAGGNIKNAVLNAARLAAYLEDKKITMKHFKQAVLREMESLTAFSADKSENEKNGYNTKPITATQDDFDVKDNMKMEIQRIDKLLEKGTHGQAE